MRNVFQIIKSRDGNVNVLTFMDEAVTADEKDMYKSTLEFQSITTEYVGRYYCVYNSSIKLNAEHYEQEVNRYKASSIYIFVDGELSR